MMLRTSLMRSRMGLMLARRLMLAERPMLPRRLVLAAACAACYQQTYNGQKQGKRQPPVYAHGALVPTGAGRSCCAMLAQLSVLVHARAHASRVAAGPKTNLASSSLLT